VSGVSSKPRSVWSFVALVWLVVLAFNVVEGFGWLDGRPHLFNQVCAGIGVVGSLAGALVIWRARVIDRRTEALARHIRQGWEGLNQTTYPPSTFTAYHPPSPATLRRWKELDQDTPSWRERP